MEESSQGLAHTSTEYSRKRKKAGILACSGLIAIVSLVTGILLAQEDGEEFTRPVVQNTFFNSCLNFITERGFENEGLVCEACEEEAGACLHFTGCNNTCEEWELIFAEKTFLPKAETCEPVEVPPINHRNVCPKGFYLGVPELTCDPGDILKDIKTFQDKCFLCTSPLGGHTFQDCVDVCESEKSCVGIVTNPLNPDDCFAVPKSLSKFCDVSASDATFCQKVKPLHQCFDSKVTLAEAKSRCANLGGKVVSATNEIEFARLKQSCLSSRKVDKAVGCWADTEEDDKCFFMNEDSGDELFRSSCKGRRHFCCEFFTEAPTLPEGETFSPTTSKPTGNPTLSPVTSQPTLNPTTSAPTEAPTRSPTTESPTNNPTTSTPTSSPTSESPTKSPTTLSPTKAPTTASPTESPVTSFPTKSPTTSKPTTSPTTSFPTESPTANPTTSQPTAAPSKFPTLNPTLLPTESPTRSPTFIVGPPGENDCDAVTPGATGLVPENEAEQFTGALDCARSENTCGCTLGVLMIKNNGVPFFLTDDFVPIEFDNFVEDVIIPPDENLACVIMDPARDFQWTIIGCRQSCANGEFPVPICRTLTNAPTSSPTRKPTPPTSAPTENPTLLPTTSPTHNPSKNPTVSPTNSPTGSPTLNPTANPTTSPTDNPTTNPTISPSINPTVSPSENPTANPTSNPSVSPTTNPTDNPTISPTENPTKNPILNPTVSPTSNPILFPTANPTIIPSANPTSNPTVVTKKPTASPTFNPTSFPIAAVPTESPVVSPTRSPTSFPTIAPTSNPTNNPTRKPTVFPTLNPTLNPTGSPTRSPSSHPTSSPTGNPTKNPTSEPTENPTTFPTENPTVEPTGSPTRSPTFSPTSNPTGSPSKQPTGSPSFSPTSQPTANPTLLPTVNPTKSPSANPTINPTENPTENPTVSPTKSPTNTPTVSPSLGPTESPTGNPTERPTGFPSTGPTTTPTPSPTVFPTGNPTTSPSLNPTGNPTISPTENPTNSPSQSPTSNPTKSPTKNPTLNPTTSPSASPTGSPSSSPTQNPTEAPSSNPTRNPTGFPTSNPTTKPTTSPTRNPTENPTKLPTDNPTESPSKSPTFNPTAFPTDVIPSVVPIPSPTDSPTFHPTSFPSTSPTFSPTQFPTVSPTVSGICKLKNGESVWSVRNDDDEVFDFQSSYLQNGHSSYAYDVSIYPYCNTASKYCPLQGLEVKPGERRYFVAPAYAIEYFILDRRCEGQAARRSNFDCEREEGAAVAPDEKCKCEDHTIFFDEFDYRAGQCSTDFFTKWLRFQGSVPFIRSPLSFNAPGNVCASPDGNCLELVGKIRTRAFSYVSHLDKHKELTRLTNFIDYHCTLHFKAAGSRRCGKGSEPGDTCFETFNAFLNKDNSIQIKFNRQNDDVLSVFTFFDVSSQNGYLDYSATADVYDKDSKAYASLFSEGQFLQIGSSIREPLGTFFDDTKVVCCCVELFDHYVYKAVFRNQGPTGSGDNVPFEKSAISSILNKPPNDSFNTAFGSVTLDDADVEELAPGNTFGGSFDDIVTDQIYSLGLGGSVVLKFDSGFYLSLIIYENSILDCRQGLDGLECDTSSMDDNEDVMVEVSVDGINFELVEDSVNSLGAWEILDIFGDITNPNEANGAGTINDGDGLIDIIENDGILPADLGIATPEGDPAVQDVQDYFTHNGRYQSYCQGNGNNSSIFQVHAIRFVKIMLPSNLACYKYVRLTDTSIGTKDADDGFDLHAIKTTHVCCSDVDHDSYFAEEQLLADEEYFENFAVSTFTQTSSFTSAGVVFLLIAALATIVFISTMLFMRTGNTPIHRQASDLDLSPSSMELDVSSLPSENVKPISRRGFDLSELNLIRDELDAEKPTGRRAVAISQLDF